MPVRPERVVEVAFDQMEGARFRHAVTFLRLAARPRADVVPAGPGRPRPRLRPRRAAHYRLSREAMTGSGKYAAVARASGEPSAGSAPAPSSASTIARF